MLEFKRHDGKNLEMILIILSLIRCRVIESENCDLRTRAKDGGSSRSTRVSVCIYVCIYVYVSMFSVYTYTCVLPFVLYKGSEYNLRILIIALFFMNAFFR